VYLIIGSRSKKEMDGTRDTALNEWSEWYYEPNSRLWSRSRIVADDGKTFFMNRLTPILNIGKAKVNLEFAEVGSDGGPAPPLTPKHTQHPIQTDRSDRGLG
jgi:hypothetical protein